MPPRPRIGVVGVGRVAADYLRVIPEIDTVELVAVADPDEAARLEAAHRTGVPAFASAREMLAAAEVEAALVLTPPSTHEPLTLDLLARGVHVLCEKPLAPTAAAAQRMVLAGSRGKAQLMMASKFRYVPDVVEARRLISSGVLGEPILFDNWFCTPVDMTQRWNSDAATSGGGVLIDNGSHAMDVARLLIGPLARVMAHFGRRVQPVRVDDTVRVLFETAGGCVGLIDLSWSIDKHAEHYVSVQGTRGTLQLGWRGSRYRLVGEPEWRPFGGGYDKLAAFAAQIRNFAASIRGEEQPLVSGEDALASVRAVEAAYRSARIGRWVPVQGYGG